MEKNNMAFTPCVVCGSDSYREICDIRISPILTPSKLVRCKECGFFYANPRLTKDAEEDYYRRRYHEMEGRDAWYEHRIGVFKRSLHEIERFLKVGKLIDVGCGMGYFMDLAKKSGWEVKGVEISDSAFEHAREKLKLDVIKGSLKDARFESEYFDVATMWNVLDQIYDPKENLIEIKRILKKGGYLFMRMPNASFHLKLLKLYDILRHLFKNIGSAPTVFHLYSFDKNSIKKFLKSTGFFRVIVKTEPMSLKASYFVSIFAKKREEPVRKSLDLWAEVVYLFTLKKIIISPSIFVIARKD